MQNQFCAPPPSGMCQNMFNTCTMACSAPAIPNQSCYPCFPSAPPPYCLMSCPNLPCNPTYRPPYRPTPYEPPPRCCKPRKPCKPTKCCKSNKICAPTKCSRPTQCCREDTCFKSPTCYDLPKCYCNPSKCCQYRIVKDPWTDRLRLKCYMPMETKTIYRESYVPMCTFQDKPVLPRDHFERSTGVFFDAAHCCQPYCNGYKKCCCGY